MKFLNSPMKTSFYFKLSLAEYVLVSLSLSLIIVKFFPVFHNQTLSKAISCEYRSLYWGTVVVSNLFIYGLLFYIGRGLSIMREIYYNIFYTFNNDGLLLQTIIPCVQEGIIHAILFIGALIASVKGKHSTDIQVPPGMGKVMIYLSFCFSCFCCCFCCSPRCKSKTL